MEPFTIRCETCRAKLRVRDERVLGQIHECPKCGSMVHIAATAGATLATASSVIASSPQESLIFPAPKQAVPATPVATEVFALPYTPVEVPPIELPPAATDWSRVVFWSAGGAALFIAGGIVGAVLLRGDDANVGTENTPPAVASVGEQGDEHEPIAAPAVENETEQLAPAEIDARPQEVATTAPPVIEEKVADVRPAVPTDVKSPVAAPPQTPPVAEKAKPARTLTLEPVKPAPTVGELVAQLESPTYETVLEEPVVAPEGAEPQADGTPGPATNVKQQLAMPIVGIELNAVPLSSFVETLSEMAAVPIVLDEDALKAAGLTPRTKITVRAQEETIASLLTSTLAQHHLAWEERDGQVVIVAAHQ